MSISFSTSPDVYGDDNCRSNYDSDDNDNYLDDDAIELLELLDDARNEARNDAEDCYIDLLFPNPVRCVTDDPIVNCAYCDVPVESSRLDRHLNNMHKCVFCNEGSYMTKTALEAHIKQEHMVACTHCGIKKLAEEIAQHELTHSVVGVVQLGILTDERFNQLVAENRIYSKDGSLYVKESNRLPNITQSLVHLNLN